jgi:predicted lipoprotein with Yx(FWY)xxD motif
MVYRIPGVKQTLLIASASIVFAACGATPAANSGSAATSAPAASAAYASSTPESTPSAAPIATATATAPPAQAAPAVFTRQNMRLGTLLVDSRGRTLYYFLPEQGGRIVCTGQCTGFWPPLFSPSPAPTASSSLPGALATIARPGGVQVTYNHWPLYTYSGDVAPDQTNGQGVNGFGGRWFAATPALRG